MVSPAKTVNGIAMQRRTARKGFIMSPEDWNLDEPRTVAARSMLLRRLIL
jgi:hypothetical protein